MGNLMSEKKGIWDRTASKFRNTYHTVKKIRKRQSSKSYYIIPIILLFIYGFYNIFVLNLLGVSRGDATQRAHPAMILYYEILAATIIISCKYARGLIKIKETEMEKYNVKLMNNKKGYLNSFKNELGEKFLFLGFKEERNNFKSEFTKEEIKAIDERYLEFIEEV